MEIREYQRLREHEDRYWWHVGRRRFLEALLKWGVSPDASRPALDIGCGTGSNFELLRPFGRFIGTEITTLPYRDGAERPARPVVVALGEKLPFADGSFGLCTFFDVLEHIEAEDAFLGEVHRILQPGGLVCLSVPAYMFLWSDHDVSLHHFRRYVRSSLARSLSRNNFELVRVTYAMASIFPLVALYRLLSKVLPKRREATASYVWTPAPLNHLGIGVLTLEARWLRLADVPFGTSLLALARRKDP